MDEDAAAAFTEDGAEGRPRSEDDAPQNYVKATETADSKYLDTLQRIVKTLSAQP